ncbi:MAG TPA: hypothetical protein VHC72_13470 [Bryobacteraceae bacterium]|nr:hypothetical protein [Bryobacteraceae bacterium]
MNLSKRDRTALTLLGGAVGLYLLLQFVILPDNTAPTSAAVAMSTDQLQQRVARLRQTAASLPVREALLKQTDADLADRERGVIQAGTAAEAQSEVLQTAQRIGKTNEIDVHSGDFPAPRAFGDYGIVYTSISFDCHIEQLLNFLADLTRDPQLIVPSEEHITATNPKDKTVTVRMLLAGVVAKKLLPEKKGLGAF